MDGVTCVGGTVADILARPVGVMPNPGRVELVDEIRLAPGGCAVNSASFALYGVNNASSACLLLSVSALA